ncbi:GAF domain-containing sensor histidine kinase [Desulfosarcina ovata]|nr:GAF domain-containing sensor histidine kinase [Desulfosarcina ovata]
MKRKRISAERLLERIASLAISGDESAVGTILHEVLSLLMVGIDADIGQINLLPKSGPVEKLFIIKDKKPWLRDGMGLHPFDPQGGFTGRVIQSGKSILVEDIWSKTFQGEPNPFLQIRQEMNDEYVQEIKKPTASIIIVPIKRGGSTFCTIELSRYRGREPYNQSEKELVDDFAQKYGPLFMNYIIDIKNRVAINTAHRKLASLSRFIATDTIVNFRDAIGAYQKLSSADIGYGFFKTGGLSTSNVRLVAWFGDEVMEVFLQDFVASSDSVLSDGSDITYPVEGKADDRRLIRFRNRISTYPGLKQKERDFIIKCNDHIKSYVIYPLHMLSQDLGAVVLGSRRPKFEPFLKMQPFLSLYNSLFKSFLLNERVARHLSIISHQIHNPGFYCLASLKGTLVKKFPEVYCDPEVSKALVGLEVLLSSLHEQGLILKRRQKNIQLLKWLSAYISQLRASNPHLIINLCIEDNNLINKKVTGTYEQLEDIFENLFTNSTRSIIARQQQEDTVIGKIDINVELKGKTIIITFQDNGLPYKTVSGRGWPQVLSIMEALGGKIYKEENPYLVKLVFNIINTNGRE